VLASELGPILPSEDDFMHERTVRLEHDASSMSVGLTSVSSDL
jgi:hypothetical protein